MKISLLCLVLRPFAALAVAVIFACSPALAKKAPDNAPDELFDGPIQVFELKISPKDMRTLRQTMGWGGSGKRPEVPATIKVGTNVFEKVTVHIKGSAGSFRPIDTNPALTLNFGKLNPDQSCFGHRKLHLNNSVQDNSLMNELVASRMFNTAGVPTPRVSHAIVILNGRPLGTYVLKEGWDKGFLKRCFGSSKGNLYDPNFVQDVNGNLERDSGEGADDQEDIKALNTALQLRSDSAFTNAFAKVVDCDKFLTYTAIQVLIDDWDGYARNRNNYRIYHDPTTDRLVFMPHGMDQLYQSPLSSFRPNFNGIAARRLFSIQEWRDALTERMREMTNLVFKPEFSDPIIASAEIRLMKALNARQDDQTEFIRSSIAMIRERMHTRMDHFANQGGIIPEVARFDANGVCRLGVWRPQREGTGAKLEIRANTAKGKVYVIRAGEAGSVGSWRSNLILAPGNYRFEGKAMSRGIRGGDSVQNVGVGAGLRISKSSRRNGIVGDTEWQTIQYQFSVESDNTDRQMRGREIVLVAELRADDGEAYFDADSFLVRRL